MSNPRHRLEFYAWNFRRCRFGHLHGAGIIVFAGQHEQPAAVGVDPSDPLPRVPVAGVERDIAKEDRGSALAIVPRDLLLPFRRALWRGQSADPFRHEQRLIDPRVRGPCGLAPGHLLAGLACDDTGECIGMTVSEFETDLP